MLQLPHKGDRKHFAETKMKLPWLIIFFFCFSLILVEARKKSGGIKIKKPKPVKIKPVKIKPVKIKPVKIPKAHKIHAVHVGRKHHKHHKHHKHNIHQAIVPMFSPAFNGTDTSQVPADFQVELIQDWLKRIKIVCDVFLSMVEVQSSDPEQQRHLIRNLYPPIRVLLEADYAQSVYLQNQNDPALLAAQTTLTTEAQSTPTDYYPGYVTDTF